MHLSSVFDSLLALGSLGSSISGVCSSNALVQPRPAAAMGFTSVTAFVDVNVVPMDTERILQGQTVLVEGGRITALGPAAKVTIPTGAVRIDGRGKYLMPGLGDMHAHVIGAEARRYLFGNVAHGITTVRHINPSGQAPLIALDTAAVSPRIYVGAPALTSPGTTPAGVATELATYKALGYDFLWTQASDVYARATLPTIDAWLTAARQLGLPAMTHDHEQALDKVLALGAVGGSTEHLYVFQDLLQRPEPSVSDAEIQTRAIALQRAGVWMTITLVCTEYADQSLTGKIKLSQRIARTLQAAGARLLLGSDVNGGRGSSAGVVHTELDLLVRAGLSPYQALVTGTRNIAEYLGVLDSSGTVTVGKRADLILLQGNPLTNVRYAREPDGVMIAGRWFDRVTLDRGLLEAPKYWFRYEVWGGMLPPSPGEDEYRKVRARHVEIFNTLTDSLALAKSTGPEGDRTYRQLLQRLADELSDIRTNLTPAHREAFDPQARVWLREQARQGHSLTIPGVAKTP